MAYRTPEFSMRVPLDRLGPVPARYRLVADEATRAAVAGRLGLLSLERLEADLDVSRQGMGARVEGVFTADVVQECVTSLAPVPGHIDGRVELRFETISDDGAEIELGADELEVLPVENGSVDLGEAVTETLAISLDPYPRAGAEELETARKWLMSEEEAEAQQRADKLAQGPFAKLGPKRS